MSLILMPPRVVITPPGPQTLFEFDASSGLSNGQAITAGVDQLSNVVGTYMTPASAGVVYSNTQKLNHNFSIYCPVGTTLDLMRSPRDQVSAHTELTWDMVYYIGTYNATESYIMPYRVHTDSGTDRFTIAIGGHDLAFNLWNNAFTAKINTADIARRSAWSRFTLTKSGNTYRILRNGKPITSTSYAALSYSLPHERILIASLEAWIDSYSIVEGIKEVDYMWPGTLTYNKDINTGNNQTTETVLVSAPYTKFVAEMTVTAYGNTSKSVYLGLVHQSNAALNVAYILEGGRIQLNNSIIGTFGSQAQAGDVIRMEVLNGTVTFFHNDVQVYTSSSSTWGGGQYKCWALFDGSTTVNIAKLTKARLII